MTTSPEPKTTPAGSAESPRSVAIAAHDDDDFDYGDRYFNNTPFDPDPDFGPEELRSI